MTAIASVVPSPASTNSNTDPSSEGTKQVAETGVPSWNIQTAYTSSSGGASRPEPNR